MLKVHILDVSLHCNGRTYLPIDKGEDDHIFWHIRM